MHPSPDAAELPATREGCTRAAGCWQGEPRKAGMDASCAHTRTALQCACKQLHMQIHTHTPMPPPPTQRCPCPCLLQNINPSVHTHAPMHTCAEQRLPAYRQLHTHMHTCTEAASQSAEADGGRFVTFARQPDGALGVQPPSSFVYTAGACSRRGTRGCGWLVSGPRLLFVWARCGWGEGVSWNP